MNKELVTNKLKIIGLILYFLILLVERILAAVFSYNEGGEYALSSGYVFNYIAYSITILSLVAGIALSIKPMIGMFKCLFTEELYPFENNYLFIVLWTMAILFGGMMHTGFTKAPIQFVAYGFLILSFIVRCVEECGGSKLFHSVISVIYITLFSMTIPVCYIVLTLGHLDIFFYIVEFLAVFVLIPLLGLMLYKFFKYGVTDFSPIYPIVMAILSGLTVGIKWKEEINYFVLIFSSLTIVFYLVIAIILKVRDQSIIPQSESSIPENENGIQN